MSPIHAEVTEVIDARPEDVYAVVSDYEVGHPAILPKPYFTGLKVEQGGKGTGTVARASMNVFGSKREFRVVVSEPEPGRVLVEADPDAGVVTTFIVEPVNGGQQSRVTIATDSEARPGFTGVMERLMNPPIMRRIYQQELRQLANYLRSKAV
ncbi:MAG: SRPBCC family protein [Chloroflexi bacterium]|nr:SRPBCC family protein [Chloroflexota bacterium]